MGPLRELSTKTSRLLKKWHPATFSARSGQSESGPTFFPARDGWPNRGWLSCYRPHWRLRRAPASYSSFGVYASWWRCGRSTSPRWPTRDRCREGLGRWHRWWRGNRAKLPSGPRTVPHTHWLKSLRSLWGLMMGNRKPPPFFEVEHYDDWD